MTLLKSFIDAWTEVLLKHGRFPKGTSLTTQNSNSLILTLAKSQRKAVFAMRDAFTKERSLLAKGFLGTRKDITAYLLGFHLTNLLRAKAVLERLIKRQVGLIQHLKRYRKVKVIDLGCGTGVMAQAVNHFWQTTSMVDVEWEFELWDTNQILLETSAHMLQEVTTGQVALIKTLKKPIETFEARFEISSDPNTLNNKLCIISLGYVWNELGPNPRARAKLLRALQTYSSKNIATLVFLTEPASEKEARLTMELKDTLLEQGYKVLYPCSHQNSCPMLAANKDWCYSEFQEIFPAIQLKLDQLFEIKRQFIASSGYVLVSPGFFQSSETIILDSQQNVLVGRPKYKVELKNHKNDQTKMAYLLCNASGLTKIPVNSKESVWQRGDIYGHKISNLEASESKQTKRFSNSKRAPAS